jgi:hypothetical protein
MRDLRDNLEELAEAGAREARVPGARPAMRRGRRRRQRRAAGAVVVLLALLAGGVAVDRWSNWSGTTVVGPGERLRPPVTTLEPANLEQLARNLRGPTGSGEDRRLVGSPRRMAEGTFQGRHWALYLFRQRVTKAAQPTVGELRWCKAMVGWEPDGHIDGTSILCNFDQDLPAGSTLTLGLDEPVENQVFVYQGWVIRRAARIRFQLTGQPPFEAQRIVDLGGQFPNNWYVAFFSPLGGTATMLSPKVRTTVTALDAAGRTICVQTFGQNGAPAKRGGCR